MLWRAMLGPTRQRLMLGFLSCSLENMDTLMEPNMAGWKMKSHCHV